MEQIVDISNLKYKEYEITNIENDEDFTLDFEVPNKHHYLLSNGVISHNTSIFANVVSGGLEPVFMPEYIRTVIVGETPNHMIDVTPKYYQGEFEETKMFKFTKEGDDTILKGKDKDGTVYKIDRNRGLTKEVLCEDYGVRWLKARGEWNAKAPWAVTALSLTTQDHVEDLKGFARWLDSSSSKTINIPYDYPFDEFKNVYLNSYKTGYIKGVTTYRSGTMAAVLSAKDEKCEEEKIILDDVKLPDSLPAVMKKLRADGKKWYLTVLMNEGNSRPLALFVHTNNHEKNVTTYDAVERLIKLARDKCIPEKFVSEIEEKIQSDNNSSKIARAISLNLRHGVLIKNIVHCLDKIEDVTVGSFLFAIKKFLATYIKDGEKVDGEKCEVCLGSEIVYQEGCKCCKSCGSSRCGS